VALHAGIASVFIIRLKVEEAILDAYEFHFVRNLVAIFPAIGTLILIFFVRNKEVSFNYFVSLSFLFLIIPGVANYVLRHWMKLLPGSIEDGSKIPADFIKNSVDTFITQMLAFLNFSGQQYFVGVVMGPAAVAVFASATRPVFMLRIMTSQTALPLMPQIVALLKTGKTNELPGFMRNANTLILIILLSASLSLLACSELFYRTWLDNDATHLAYLSNVAILGLVASGCAGVVSRYFVFSGEPRRIAIIQAKCSMVFVVTSLISLYWGGIDFFLWSIAGNAFLVSGLVFKEYVQQAGISWRYVYHPKLIVWLVVALSVTFTARIYIKNLPAKWLCFGLAIIPMGLFMGALSYIVFHQEIKSAFQSSKNKS
jgi:O-antigen/teichoic acid export membrane protein